MLFPAEALCLEAPVLSFFTLQFVEEEIQYIALLI
jgi:hypothetical protein